MGMTNPMGLEEIRQKRHDCKVKLAPEAHLSAPFADRSGNRVAANP